MLNSENSENDSVVLSQGLYCPSKLLDSHHLGVLNSLDLVLETVEHVFEMTRKIDVF